jgi:hypothetical protein
MSRTPSRFMQDLFGTTDCRRERTSLRPSRLSVLTFPGYRRNGKPSPLDFQGKAPVDSAFFASSAFSTGKPGCVKCFYSPLGPGPFRRRWQTRCPRERSTVKRSASLSSERFPGQSMKEDKRPSELVRRNGLSQSEIAGDRSGDKILKQPNCFVRNATEQGFAEKESLRIHINKLWHQRGRIVIE